MDNPIHIKSYGEVSFKDGVTYGTSCGLRTKDKTIVSTQYRDITCLDCINHNSRLREFDLYLDIKYGDVVIGNRTFKASEVYEKMSKGAYLKDRDEYVKSDIEIADVIREKRGYWNETFS